MLLRRIRFVDQEKRLLGRYSAEFERYSFYQVLAVSKGLERPTVPFLSPGYEW
jgi:hypothetical protein